MAVLVVGNRLRPKTWEHASDEGAGPLALDLVKTFFVAVVAFVFVICWEQNQTAHDHTVDEAKGLVAAYQAVHSMPEPYRAINDRVRAYNDEVRTDEWHVMERDAALSESTGDMLNTLRAAVTAVRSEDATVMEARAAALAALDRVSEARQDRALDAGGTLPTFLFITLVVGAILVLLDPVLSGTLVTMRSLAMTALLGVVVGLTVLAIHNVERPYSGVLGVSTDAFDYADAEFQRISAGIASVEAVSHR
ncbi:DUF4239 domain-containing protein [Nocardia sp. NPDC048505]|uniref:bestrophin-like domain n=1 Tax=unclassified Nocardia TaxID=2637762 RepID=UPI0034054876